MSILMTVSYRDPKIAAIGYSKAYGTNGISSLDKYHREEGLRCSLVIPRTVSSFEEAAFDSIS